MSATTKEIDKLEQIMRDLEEKSRPKAQKLLSRDKKGRPVIEYRTSGPESAFEHAKAELARTSNFVPALPLSPFHQKMERNSRRQAPPNRPPPSRPPQPKARRHQGLHRRSALPPKFAS
jgi:hypothetical protein